MNYGEPASYNKQYTRWYCNLENAEIKRLLRIAVPPDITVTDIGCGTGLVRTMLENDYIGIDKVAKSIEYCKKNYEGLFLNMKAEEYVKMINGINPIFCFSLDYIELETIEEYLRKTDEVFVAVHYNMPYLSNTSVYSGRKLLFEFIHPRKKREKTRELLKDYRAVTKNLLNDPYYFVSVVR